MKQKSVLEMTGKEARKFFLKEESYFTLERPKYYKLSNLLDSVTKITGDPRSSKYIDVKNLFIAPNQLSLRDDLNYVIYINKDRNYIWRPLTIINPFLYVDLVDFITKDEVSADVSNGWEFIVRRFKEFKNDKIHCASIPVESLSEKTDKSRTILNWWEQFEQHTINKSIDFSYCLFTDISNFYPSIYTHSIPWALYGKEVVKSDLKKYNKSFGGKIDEKIRRMQSNQTNGIPQGSILMDFIAEIILGYIDYELSNELKEEDISDYFVIRYRDDYRIFANNMADIEKISERLQKVLLRFNLNLGASKTFVAKDIITDAIKKDKLYWEPYRTLIKSSINCENNKNKISLQKHLLEILKFSKIYPNSGMIKRSLNEFYKDRLPEICKSPKDYEILISILVDLMINNPESISYCVLIIGKLLENTLETKGNETIEKIVKKYKDRASKDYIEIWLQRLEIMFYDKNSIKTKGSFKSKIHQKVLDDKANLFPDDLKIIKKYSYLEPSIVDRKKFNKMKKMIIDSEIDILKKENYPY